MATKKSHPKQIKPPTIVDECPSCKKPILYCQCPLPEELKKPEETKPTNTLKLLQWNDNDGCGFLYLKQGDEVSELYTIRRMQARFVLSELVMWREGLNIELALSLVPMATTNSHNCTCDEYNASNGKGCRHVRALNALKAAGKI